MKIAKYWDKLSKNKVQCKLCPRDCKINENKIGFCRVRKNIKGVLYSLVYGKCISTAIDPIEKKPLFNFMPGTKALSIGTVGCNLKCKHCQNWEISQSEIIEGKNMTPKEIIDMAIKYKCESIAYTYNDPIVFFEFVLDCAKLAKKKGIKNIIVCNGFINQEPLKEWLKYIDAANIDYKGDDEFYRKITIAWLIPVQESIKTIHESKCFLELTNLLIPGLNDSQKQIKKMCDFIHENIGDRVPLHISRFFPYFQLKNIEPTSEKSLLKAKKIAEKIGLKYVYIGNLETEYGENTHCPECGKIVIKRNRFKVLEQNLIENECKFCESVVDVMVD